MTSLLSAYVCLKYLMYLVWSSQETPSQTNPALDWFSTSVKERAGRKGAGFKWVLCRHCIWHRPPHSSFTCFHRVCVWSSAHSHALYSCLCLSFSAFTRLSLPNCVPLCLSHVYTLALTSACAVRLASLSLYDTHCCCLFQSPRARTQNQSVSLVTQTELCIKY